jgi:hypothetical protein
MNESVIAGLRRIEVDLQGLRAFAERLGADVDASLNPMGEGIMRDYASGVPFGAGLQASDVVQATQQKYQLCLTAGNESLTSFLYSVEVLMAGARAIAERYAQTDELAGATTADVQALLRQAQTSVEAVDATDHAEPRVR